MVTRIADRLDLVSLVGQRIANITDEEVRDLIWLLTEEVYEVGVNDGKAYYAQIESFNRAAKEKAKKPEPEADKDEPSATRAPVGSVRAS